MIGHHNSLLHGFDTATTRLPTDCNLALSLDKTVVVMPEVDSLTSDQQEEWHRRGVSVGNKAKFLGGCLSTDETVIEFVEDRVGPECARAQRALELLKHPRMRGQSVIHYCTSGVQHWLDYTARLVSPSDAQELYQKWDNVLLDLILSKTGRSEMLPDGHLPKYAEKLKLEKCQMQLPVHYGGIGLRPLATVSLVAYLASLAAAADEILHAMQLVGTERCPQRYVEQYEFCRNALIEMDPDLESATFEDSLMIKALELKYLPPSLKAYLQTFQEWPDLSVKFQKRLSKPVWKAQQKKLVRAFGDLGMKADQRRLNSYAGRGLAGRIWTVAPCSSNLLADAHVAQNLRLQGGAMPAAWMYLHEGAIMCRGCGKVDITVTPAHGNHCIVGLRDSKTKRHDALCHVAEIKADKNGIPVVWQPHLPDGSQTDLGFLFPQNTVQVDVTVHDPSAPSVHGTGNDPTKSKAHKAADGKIKRYDDMVTSVGDVFVPLAFEVSGAHTRHVDILIRRIRDAGVDNGVSVPVGAQEIRDALAVTLARHNAYILIHHTSRQRADTVLYKEARKVARRTKQAARLRMRRRHGLVQEGIDGDG